MKLFHVGFKHLRRNSPYGSLLHCHQCDEEQELITHGYCKRWGVWIMGRMIFWLDTKRQYQLCCEKCGNRQQKPTNLRFRDIPDNRQMIVFYSPIAILPLLYIVARIVPLSRTFLYAIFLIWFVGAFIYSSLDDLAYLFE